MNGNTNASNKKITYETQTYTYTTTGSSEYTGLSLTLKSGCVHIVSVSANHINSSPLWCAITSSSSNLGNTVITQAGWSSNSTLDYIRAEQCMCEIDCTSASQTVYVWAKYSGATSNTITARIISIPID